MTHIRVGEVTVGFQEDGPTDGEPILLIMGLGMQLIAWPPAIVDGLVAEGFRVIRFDNRDIGLSSRTEAPLPSRTDVLKSLTHRRLAKADYTLADMAADAVGVLDHLGIDRTHVVGASMGGMIAQQIVIDFPERVRSLCSIMSTTGDRRRGRIAPSLLASVGLGFTAPRPEDPQAAEDVAVRVYQALAGDHANVEELRAMVRASLERGPNPHAVVRQLSAILASPDRTAALRRVTVPTLVIHGLKDKLVSFTGGLATARAVPGSRLLAFPDMAHDLPGPRRAEIVEAIARNARRAGAR